MDYDEDRIYYSYQNLQSQPGRSSSEDQRRSTEYDAELTEDKANASVIRRHFREFLRNYRTNQRYLYREKLLRMHQREGSFIDVDLSHLAEYDSHLLDALLRQPVTAIPAMDAAAKDALKMLLQENIDTLPNVSHGSRADHADALDAGSMSQQLSSVSDIQLLFKGNIAPTPLRSIQSQHIHTIIKCPGIVISSSRLRSKATSLTVRCTRCNDKQLIPSMAGPFGGFVIPKNCKANPTADVGTKCPEHPYVIIPDECQVIDQQTLKLQEAPEVVPTGEMPRSILMSVDRALVDRASPGTRVSVLAIPTLFNASSSNSTGTTNANSSVKTVYLRVVGLERDSGSGGHVSFTPREEEAFRLLARRADIYDILYRSIAPSISGDYTVDIKKALACQLFSGSRKKLPDGMKLRGDINILLLGDPSMAKSQFLKYVTRIAPIGIYTSGKGSSAAGLTASVVKDQRGEFYLEGGAMVLADGGIVAIDEFDKMRAIDRVAIHEAMEQQTISVAKAGITTVLNSRSSVLAAANPVFGRYDDLKSTSENIDLMSTILSRFDLIFLVRDVRDEVRDKMICHHVMGVHMNHFNLVNSNQFQVNLNGIQNSTVFDESNFGPTATDMVDASPDYIAENAMRLAISGNGVLDIPTMKKYIQYCKATCSPRLTEESSQLLSSSYVSIRDDVRKRLKNASSDHGSHDQGASNHPAIPITVRQLEALVRISESLAKMRLENEVQVGDVSEALRLFKVSTMAANASDKTHSSIDDARRPSVDQSSQQLLAASLPSLEETQRTESFLRSRLCIGIVVNRQRILEEAISQGYSPAVVAKAISVMVTRDEIQERNKGRLIKRIR